MDVDKLANEIRRVDGDSERRLGAGALAEALMPFLADRANHTARADVAEGYVLVPKEPTEAMLIGGAYAVAHVPIGSIYMVQASAAYAAMLAASPSQGPREDAEGRRDYRALHAEALAAVKAFDDWANVNETEFTGWGEGDVPPEAEFWRVKSGQSLKALLEIRPSGDSA